MGRAAASSARKHWPGRGSFRRERCAGAEKIASRDDANRLAGFGGIDDDDSADIVADHFIGDFAESGIGINRDGRAADQISYALGGNSRGIVNIAESKNADKISLGVDDGISLMGPSRLGGGQAMADGLDGFVRGEPA